MSKLTAATWIPASAAIAAIIATISIVRAVDSPQVEIVVLRQRIVAVENSVELLRRHQDESDKQAEVRWERALNDLSQIKQDLAKVSERLGIADSRDAREARDSRSEAKTRTAARP